MGVAAQGPKQAAGLNVPDPHESVDAGAGERQTVRREGDGPDAVRVAAKSPDFAGARGPIFERVQRGGRPGRLGGRLCGNGRRSAWLCHEWYLAEMFNG